MIYDGEKCVGFGAETVRTGIPEKLLVLMRYSMFSKFCIKIDSRVKTTERIFLEGFFPE